jgi:hypothetical protein
VIESVPILSARLCFAAPVFLDAWLVLGLGPDPVKRLWAVTPAERLRLRCILDAVLGKTYGLDGEGLNAILGDCDHPSETTETAGFGQKFDQKGFWRVDKAKDPELRHTVLTLVAFHDLEKRIHACGGDREKGIEAFFAQNDGEGWMLPETLRLADYDLGHDDRAGQPQPVASRLGPRFYDWQLAQSPEESWRECHLHARNLLGESGYRALLADIEAGKRSDVSSLGRTLQQERKRGQGSLFE